MFSLLVAWRHGVAHVTSCSVITRCCTKLTRNTDLERIANARAVGFLDVWLDVVTGGFFDELKMHLGSYRTALNNSEQN